MSAVVLDTDVVSYLYKQHSLAKAYASILAGHRLYISFMTVAELHKGMYWAGWDNERTLRMEAALQAYTVIQSSGELCRAWGWVRFQRKPRPISTEDAWIAATALLHDCFLATHNDADYTGIPGLRLLIPNPRA